jgi:hypothetical protein
MISLMPSPLTGPARVALLDEDLSRSCPARIESRALNGSAYDRRSCRRDRDRKGRWREDDGVTIRESSQTGKVVHMGCKESIIGIAGSGNLNGIGFTCVDLSRVTTYTGAHAPL